MLGVAANGLRRHTRRDVQGAGVLWKDERGSEICERESESSECGRVEVAFGRGRERAAGIQDKAALVVCRPAAPSSRRSAAPQAGLSTTEGPRPRTEVACALAASDTPADRAWGAVSRRLQCVAARSNTGRGAVAVATAVNIHLPVSASKHITMLDIPSVC